MIYWKFNKGWNNQEFNSIELMTDIWFYINKQHEITSRSFSLESPHLEIYLKQENEKITRMFEEKWEGE